MKRLAGVPLLVLSLTIVSVMVLPGIAHAQSLGGTILGAFEDSIGNSTTVAIPNYGTHAVVNLTTVMPTPQDALRTVESIFSALASGRSGTTSVSIHASAGFGEPDYVLLLQMIDGAVSVYLNGEPYAP